MNALIENAASLTGRLYALALAHKVLSGVVIVIVLAGGYYGYKAYAGSTTTTEYTIGTVAKGAIRVTVDGSGQVEANQQISLSPKASGTVTAVYAKAGDAVSAGQIIARIDDTDAEKSLRDAQMSLTSAQISYQEALSSANKSTASARTDAFTTAQTVVNDLRTITAGLQHTLYDTSDISGHKVQQNVSAYASVIGAANGQTQVAQAVTDFQKAQASYDALRTEFTNTTSDASDQAIQKLISDAYQASLDASQATKSVLGVLNAVDDQLTAADLTIPTSFSTFLTDANDYTSTLKTDSGNAHDANTTLADALATLSETSSDTLTIESAKLTLAKAQNSYVDARDALEDYIVRAPFAGTIGTVSVKVYDSASSGTAVATLVTNEQYANLSLNEVDAAKIKAGQKATLTFDAIDGLTLPGTVAEVDSIGTVSSGVVTYAVKISFDEQDARIKSGMTVNATIIAAEKEDALLVPSSALQTVGTKTYVTVVESGITAPSATTASSTSTAKLETVSASSVTTKRVPVTIGLQNDTTAEITDGVTEGAAIVTKSTTSSSSTTTTTSSSKSSTRQGGGMGALF